MVDHQLDTKVVPQGLMDSMVHHLMVLAHTVIQDLVDNVNKVHLHMVLLRLDLHLSSYQDSLVAEGLLHSRVFVHSVHKTSRHILESDCYRKGKLVEVFEHAG